MEMATIHIDDQSYEVDAGKNLLHVCLSLGLDLPYFCWHPALGSVGACRQCAVKQFRDAHDRQGRIVMACMTPAVDGARISIADPEARAFRESVIEWLMANHPHDCPVCEEGGECHLQDMTLMTGHVYRRYRFRKRTFRNQYLGPFINHEMNRCIACYRCVRFYQDYTGGRDLHAFAAHNHVYFGRYEDGALENEFSGNLVEVCPTGVFTDRTLSRSYTRKWDLRSAPSVCVHCGLGCNTNPGERYGELRRILNRYNGQVNGYFLCDRGRFGYGFVNGEGRVRQPLLRRDGTLQPADRDEALRQVAALLARPDKVIGIGSPRASLEANFALRTLVGAERFYLGVSETEQRLLSLTLEILRDTPAHIASLQDAEQADAVLILGEDVTNTAPRLALSLRQAVRQKSLALADRLGIPRWQDAAVREAAGDARSPLFVLTPDATRLDDVATRAWRAAPDDIARLGFAVANRLDPASPPPSGLPKAQRELADAIAQALQTAERPLIVAGMGGGNEAVLKAAANVAQALDTRNRKALLCLTVPECNTLGLGLMGGGALTAAFQAVHDGTADTVIVLENDLYRRAARPAVERVLAAAAHVVVLDHVLHETAARAEVVLPAGTFAESDGTLVSSEGRAQRYFQVFAPAGAIQESWRWLRDAMLAAGRREAADWHALDEVTAACAAALPALRRSTEAAPSARFRVAGMKVQRAPHRYSGRTAMTADVDVHEPRPPDDPDSPLSFTMEGYYGRMPSALLPFFWAPSWNSIQSVNKFQDEVGGALRGGDPGVRLITPDRAGTAAYYSQVPAAFKPRHDEFLVVPLHHIFGSEELSARAPAIAGRMPAPYLALHPDDAARVAVRAGETAALVLAGGTHHLPVVLRETLPYGVAGLPAGLPGLAGLDLPVWAVIAKAPP